MAAWASSPALGRDGRPGRGEQCSELMSRARAVLVPSVWEETFGLVVVEAMAAGVPPIAAGHGSFAELITPGTSTACCSGPATPRRSRWPSPTSRRIPSDTRLYGEQARKTYEQRFDPEHSLKHLLEIYRFAIAHPA